jgi:hypothetical protein
MCWKCFAIECISWLAVTAIFLAMIVARNWNAETWFLRAIIVLLPSALILHKIHPHHLPPR